MSNMVESKLLNTTHLPESRRQICHVRPIRLHQDTEAAGWSCHFLSLPRYHDRVLVDSILKASPVFGDRQQSCWLGEEGQVKICHGPGLWNEEFVAQSKVW